MRSPITGKLMELRKEKTTLPFRKDEFEVMYHYYLCKDTGEQFTDDNLDTINITQVHNQYREKYGIPFPQEIKDIREKYGVSASKMAEILGLGPNSYRLYESGEMPSVAIGRLILSVNQPEEFIRQVEASVHILSSTERKKLIDRAKKLEEYNRVNGWSQLLEEHIFRFNLACEFSGYKKPDWVKIEQVISFFQNEIELYKTKLNKLLFYADFLHYRRMGNSITGLAYRAIPFGPVPAEYDKVYMKLIDDQKIDIIQVEFDNGNFGEVVKTCQKTEEEVFTEKERDVLNEVVKKFRKKSTRQIVEISHLEPAWIENKDNKDFISYQKYAFELQALN